MQRQSVCQQVSGDAVVEVAAPVLNQSQRPVALPAPTSMALTCRGGADHSIKSAHFGAPHQMPLRAGSPFLSSFRLETSSPVRRMRWVKCFYLC